jgi:hypothetical protein
MDQLVKNLRILMWTCVKEKAYDYPSEKSLTFFSVRTGLPGDRLHAFLLGKQVPSDHEAERISSVFGFNKEELYLSNLIEEFNVNILSENIDYLFKQLPRGGLTEFTEWVGVDQSSVSRWRHGQTPGKQNLEKIKEYFRLNNTEDLKSSLLFLSLEPVGDRQRKNECIRLLNELEVEEFAKMYPALKKLLS